MVNIQKQKRILLDGYIARNVPADKYPILVEALWRYMNLINVARGGVDGAVVAGDKQKYPHLIKTHHGDPVWDESECINFMAEVTDLPAEWCKAIMDRDYIEPLPVAA